MPFPRLSHFQCRSFAQLDQASTAPMALRVVGITSWRPKEAWWEPLILVRPNNKETCLAAGPSPVARRPLRYFISTRAIELAESIPGGLEGSVSGPNQCIQPVPTKSGPELWQLIRFSPCSNPSCTEASWKLGSILSPRISQMPPSQKIIRMVLMGTTMPPLQSETRFV
jgi:hypothetical protein